MAARSFSLTLGANKRSDVVEGTSAPGAGFIEIRLDEAISTDQDKIEQTLIFLLDYIREAKRYA